MVRLPLAVEEDSNLLRCLPSSLHGELHNKYQPKTEPSTVHEILQFGEPMCTPMGRNK